MAQHTPGPWHAVTIYGTRAEVVADTRPWEKYHRLAVIAKVEGDPNWGDAHAERDANAHLIAAAPALLEAAQVVWQSLLPDAEANAGLIEILKAAIDLAEGAE